MPVKKKDTDRALSLLEEYCKKLRKPEEQLLKNAVKKVMSIFKSSLFQALLDIQEFYEVTLLNSQKSCEQKIEEANHVAQKWEKTLLLDSCRDSLQKSSEHASCSGPKENALYIEQNKENQCSENETEEKTCTLIGRLSSSPVDPNFLPASGDFGNEGRHFAMTCLQSIYFTKLTSFADVICVPAVLGTRGTDRDGNPAKPRQMPSPELFSGSPYLDACPPLYCLAQPHLASSLDPPNLYHPSEKSRPPRNNNQTQQNKI